jgi:hypothetical protein
MEYQEITLSSRKELIDYLSAYWKETNTLVQVTRELGCHFDIYPEDTYEVNILVEKGHWVDPYLRYQCLAAIDINKQTHEQLYHLMQYPDEDLSPLMSVETFLESIVTRAEIIDALLPLL